MKYKVIDINQRIPLSILHMALESYLSGVYSSEYIVEQLRLEFRGENRIRKSIRVVEKTILRNPMMDFLEAHKSEIKIALKNKCDRNAIIIALFNCTFPFSFDVLRAFGRYFAVQDVINIDSIKKSLSDRYGGNRANENAIYSVVPMFIEGGFFARPKPGFYQMKKGMKVSSEIARLIYIESFKTNSALDGIQDYQLRDPYFLFINHG